MDYLKEEKAKHDLTAKLSSQYGYVIFDKTVGESTIEALYKNPKNKVEQCILDHILSKTERESALKLNLFDYVNFTYKYNVI